MNVYEKIMLVRNNVLNMDIPKSGHNKFSNFKYYELKDFLPVATKLFLQNKLYSRFSVIPATTTEQEKASLVVINIENPEETEEYILPTAECFIGKKKDGTGGADPIQNLGGKVTYLRRYMYGIVLDLVEDDSVDSQDTTNRKYNTSNPNKPTEEEEFIKHQEIGKAKLIKSLDKAENITHKDVVIKNVCDIIGVKEWKDITFKGNLDYGKLTALVKQELQKEKDLAQAGI